MDEKIDYLERLKCHGPLNHTLSLEDAIEEVTIGLIAVADELRRFNEREEKTPRAEFTREGDR